MAKVESKLKLLTGLLENHPSIWQKETTIAKKYTVFTYSKHGFIATLWQTDTYTISSILSKRVLRDILPYKEKELLPERSSLPCSGLCIPLSE